MPVQFSRSSELVLSLFFIEDPPFTKIVIIRRIHKRGSIRYHRLKEDDLWIHLKFQRNISPTVISLYEIRILTLRRITPVREEEICFNFFFAGCCSIVQSRWTFPLFSIFLSLSLSLLRFSFLSRTEDSEKRVIAFSSLSLSLSLFFLFLNEMNVHT